MLKRTLNALIWYIAGMILMAIIVWFTMPSFMLIQHKSDRSYDEMVAV